MSNLSKAAADALQSATASLRSGESWRWLLWAALFALAYGQSPLYTSNQNQYFLHGLANAGFGQLSDDWLAKTLDPTPLFSLLVQASYSAFGPRVFYLVYGLILGLYFVSLRSILNHVLPSPTESANRWLRPLALVIAHAAALRFVLSRGLGPEATYLLEGGLAGQRLLGEVLQPSVFGVLLIASVALFLNARPYAAVLVSAAAATVHPTYLLSAAALTIAYGVAIARRRADFRRVFSVGLVSLAAVSPVLWATWTVYRPTGPELFRLATAMLVEERIPHHALPSAWFSAFSLATLAWIALGAFWSRRTRLAPVFVVPAVIGLALSLIQVVTGSHTLALLFPWRISTFLVPLALGMAAWRASDWIGGQWARLGLEDRAMPFMVYAAAAALAAAGLGRGVLLAQQRAEDAEALIFAAATGQLSSGDQYLIPPKLQRFRLETGAPAYVDFKSIPYRDTDLLAWQERLELAQFFYRDAPELIDCGLLPRIHEDGAITHVVLEADQFGLTCPGLSQIYADATYALYRYQPPQQ